MTKTFLIATLLAMGGCARSYTEPTLSTDHPANASAAEAPAPTRWRTLDLAAADPLTPVQIGEGMDHAGHTMGENVQPEATPPAPESGVHKHDSPPPPPQNAAVLYVCPMHPEVTSDKPDQRCPKCNMKLKPVPTSGGTR